MNSSLVIVYLALGALIVFVEIRRIWFGQPVDSLSFFNCAFFLFFVFVPLNVLVLGEAAIRQKYAYQTWSHGDIGTAVSLILSYVLFVLGYYRRRVFEGVSGGCLGQYAIKIVYWLIGGLFLLGFMALAYHVSLMGGVVEALKFAPYARTGEFRLDGQLLFIRQFAYFLATAFMLCWAIYIDTIATGLVPRTYLRILLILLGLVFIFYALSTYGRREFFYPLMICLVIWTLAGQRRWWGGLGWLLALSTLWLAVYSVMIPSSSHPSSSHPSSSHPSSSHPSAVFLTEAYLRTTQGLGDSFMHFVAAEHATLWQFGFLSDIWEIPLQLVPSQALGFERSRGMFNETSEFILGRPLEKGLSGEEPLGLHGYLLVNFSYPGMFLLFYLGGLCYRILDAKLRPAIGGTALGWLVYIWAIVAGLEFLREGVLILILKPRFSWWLTIGILLWYEYTHSAHSHESIHNIPSKAGSP